MIKSIVKIKNCPSFINFKPASDLPEFSKYNLIYGWNGSGKTCFSRVLRSFETSKNYYEHPEREPKFEFKLDNRTSISNKDLNNFKSIRVFNKDFIDDNLFFNGGPKPIFFLGKVSKDDMEKIIKIENELKDLRKDRDLKKTQLDKANANNNRMLSEKARDIKNTLTTTRKDKYRNYERPNLEETINNKSDELKNADNFKLEKNHLSALKKAIQQTTKPIINPLLVPNFNITDILKEVSFFLQKTVISQIIEALESDDVVSKWVEHGLTIHKDRYLTTCAFCNQTIPQARFRDLENYFNEDYQKLIEKLIQLKNELFTRKVTTIFPDTSNFYDDLINEYLSKKKEADNLIKTFNQNLDSVFSIIEQKEQKPFSKFRLESVESIEENSLEEINEIIAQHNKKSENFESQLDEKKYAIEMHFIAEFIDAYNEIVGEINTHENKYNDLLNTVDQKEKEIRRLKETLISHHIPAQHINKNLEHFLGRSDIQLRAINEKAGYQITRNGEIAKDLSEGEKTALAIVYFLTKIKEEGFDLKNSIIVIDDPVSSLDSNSIFQAFSFIKESIKEAGQIFILTHHFDFFRQVKNWFANCKKAEREYFMIVCSREPMPRKSSIIKIDKLLIDFESEYHFLFSILYRFAKEEQQHLEKMYPIPNIARKFLENFLAFRVPVLSKKGNSKEPQIYQRLKMIKNFDSKKKERIRRFVETHSHPRYESGVQDFDLTILGETSDILNDLIDLVKKEDPKHYGYLVESVTDQRTNP